MPSNPPLDGSPVLLLASVCPSHFSCSSAGHKAGPFPGFCSWNESALSFALIQPLACALHEAHLKSSSYPDFNQVLNWAPSHFSCLYLALIDILAIFLGHSWAGPEGLDTHLHVAFQQPLETRSWVAIIMF